jgi:hypothetical protein
VTYGAKAWAVLSGLAGSFRRVCFWHTFDPRLAPQLTREHPVVREARGYAEAKWPPPTST